MTAATTYTDYPADAAVPITEEQKFVFDLKGWLLLPSVLSEEELAPIREHALRLKTDYDNVPAHERSSLGGPAQVLTDHPAIVGVLRTILGEDVSDKSYGFRCEGTFVQRRTYGEEGIPPHGGGGMSVGPMVYQARNRQIHSGLTRVVWELNDVDEGMGGTLIMSGTHKMNFPIPERHMQRDSPLFETYSCPAGSVLIFSESLCHSGTRWLSKKNDRLAIFNAYNAGSTQYHKMSLDPAIVETMPPKRQTLFRGVWQADFRTEPAARNDFYSRDNRAW